MMCLSGPALREAFQKADDAVVFVSKFKRDTAIRVLIPDNVFFFFCFLDSNEIGIGNCRCFFFQIKIRLSKSRFGNWQFL